MASFIDNKGMQWDIDLNAYNTLTVRNRLDYDVTKMFKDSELARLNDYALLVNVVYLLVKEQADERKISDIDFGKAMAGDAFSGAVDAMMEALRVFTPSKNRPALQLVIEAGRKLDQMATAQVEAIKPDDLVAMVMSKSETSSPGATN